ncbi:DNA polymerase III subunit delta' [Mesorhizobium sp. M1C.F.Ca.ET.193.01.1.1]|uniref:DNA polymerase III subunit delta' n=1 Tax=unclassified Mesorhizobium TaxID=325217 RepID=UPI000FD300F8|nr:MULTISPECIES: DNA polymerase III subunit delta' [unclassified Mesorhizobium]TGT03426.1 DNA polymerase III subunit delta' [bacterium M00.F.Ca.ET.177.01.1.1]TGQ56108.1 DNA polymerase III subunit delta' [Mesorhizobium sp. M1C.F.Ca.ET.210.01.1.1]TGQ75193.1 DNA polymerase III subunit delta' [Mesorhizobium sp. M1C.F.Ca.ET.212.01.1.1]TGR13605.1 DNA polymerase III subunit delta' [Mesorhizobium sp. M1C.F.Ca.ET.204.01.1.1]TGR33881.1 DNA polymerase III subunit delta' [Mesorhizobium sp. M1C.F.Ca.ET.196
MIFERIAPEQHDTLDGVPEPSETPRLIGHAQAAGMLAAAYRSGKLPHALILAGPLGIGKATLAFHLAYHLLKYPDFAAAPETLAVPDPASSLFRQIATGAHPSVLHLTRPANDKTKSFKTVLTVDEIRKVSRFLSMTSHDGSYRVVIVDPADDMNTNAANALLKNLEEPPARTLFILIVHAPGSLLPTIRSRCQMVRLTPLAPDELMAVLGGIEPPPPEDPAARAALAERAGGSARNAILLTQYGGLEIAGALDALVAARKPDIAGAHRLAEAVAGRDQAIQFDIFNRRALDLLSAAASEAALGGDLARAKTLSEAWHEALNTISEAETYNLDKKQHALTMIDRLNSVMRM